MFNSQPPTYQNQNMMQGRGASWDQRIERSENAIQDLLAERFERLAVQKEKDNAIKRMVDEEKTLMKATH